LGADGEDFVPIAEEINLPVAVRYIFPHAPKRPVTLNSGFVMRAWYDISESDLESQLKEQTTASNKMPQEYMLLKPR
jgi:phospholipase/carboxylesterase